MTTPTSSPSPLSPTNLSPATLKRQIDSAVASLQKDEHVAVLFKVNQDGASVAAIGQALDGHLRVMARVTKPWGAGVGWDVSGGVSFAVPPKPPPAPITWEGLVYYLQHPSHPLEANGWLQARIKAAGYFAGLAVYADGRRWFSMARRGRF